MEAQVGGETRRFYGNGTPDLLLKEKGLMGFGQNQEWNLNDWKWDGNRFLATPLNPSSSECRNRQFVSAGSGIPAGWSDVNGGEVELEKRRRVLTVEDDDFDGGEGGSLTLKLGEQVFPISETEARNGKKSKLQMGGSSGLNRSVCQVENCGIDLNCAKEYHKRHKVCEMHSKATKALVGNVMQRFCQQCSRFHVLQEFDEGKRSCRRRLAGHNRRRRKTHPDSVSGNSLSDDRASSYLLITLIRILSNLHSNSLDKAKDQDLLSHILRNLASSAGTSDGTGLSELLQASRALQNAGPSVGIASEKVPTLLSNVDSVTVRETSRPLAAKGMEQKGIGTDDSAGETLESVPTRNFLSGPPGKAESPISSEPMLLRAPTVERVKLNNFDLNCIYYEPQDCTVGTGSPDCPLWVVHDTHQSSPPQTSDNSYTGSAESPSSSNGDVQSRTDRIVFKLFGKDPNDFPLLLRGQILDWLSNSPTDIESYIRPGCIILTIYLRLTESAWEELCCVLNSSLTRLLDISDDVFWRSGWIYATAANQIAFIYNGQVVLDSPLCLKAQNRSKISSVTPIAVPVSEKANFTVKGFNLSRSTTKLFCAYEGNYLVQDACDVMVGSTDHEDFQSVRFFCSLPNVIGRGFIEVEDQDLSSDFFPFIVAEQDVCSEICTLESIFEEVMDHAEEIQKMTEKIVAKSRALEFLQEIGWLLQRSQLSKSRLADTDSSFSVFPLTRFKWLLEFSVDHDWCAVAKKLLDILFDGNVDVGIHTSIKLMLVEMGLLHGAIRRKSRRMVEFLLNYIPDRKTSVETATQHNQPIHESFDSFIFKPDDMGPAGVTPLHIAASSEDAEDVLDALTNDPALVGIEAWKNAKDKTGFAPEDYARLRGYYSYIQLVQKKINKKLAAEHVLDIPGHLSKPSETQKKTNSPAKEASSGSWKLRALQVEKCGEKAIQQYCGRCDQQIRYRNMKSSLLYRPAMLSMVAIAAVCVCVGLIFKGPPEVLFVFPFRWELLGYGPI